VKITALEYQKNDPDRVSIFVDGEYSFGMYVNDVVGESIFVGKDITEEDVLIILKKDITSRLYNRCLDLLTGTFKTERQIREHIYKVYRQRASDWDIRSVIGDDISVIADEIIARLNDLGLIDDSRFAKAYISSYYLRKPVSLYELKGKLLSKGISGEIIDDAFYDLELDESEMLKFAIQKRSKNDRIKKGDDKLIQYLSRKGFSWDLISMMIDE
jgi:regulatory protein